MTTRAHRIRFAIGTAILVGAASAATLANHSQTLIFGPKTPLCYCHCDHAKQCTKMCDLPKYENRWWANSCRKKTALKSPDAPAAISPSRKTNRKEQAQL